MTSSYINSPCVTFNMSEAWFQAGNAFLNRSLLLYKQCAGKWMHFQNSVLKYWVASCTFYPRWQLSWDGKDNASGKHGFSSVTEELLVLIFQLEICLCREQLWTNNSVAYGDLVKTPWCAKVGVEKPEWPGQNPDLNLLHLGPCLTWHVPDLTNALKHSQ